MTVQLFQIQIPKRSVQCCAKEETFVSGMEYFSLLKENDKNEYERLDYCVSCFQEALLKNEIKNGAKYWKSKVPLKKRAPSSPQNKDVEIFELFKNSIAEVSDESNGISFVLALYLCRKRAILLRKEIIKDNLTFQIYEIAETEEMVAIKKMNFLYHEVEEIQRQIASKLNEPR